MNRFTLHSVCAVAIAAALGACKTTSPTASAVKEGGGRPVGEFIGGPSIQQILWENLFDQSAAATKKFQVTRVLGKGVYAQKGLIGANDVDGDRFDYRGGVPNPLGVLLWYKTMKALASSMGAVCAQAPDDKTLVFARSADRPVLRADVYALLRKLCTAPAADADLEQAWKTVVGYGLDDERAAFKAQFKDVDGDGAKRVEGIMLSLLMNPSFLLQQ